MSALTGPSDKFVSYMWLSPVLAVELVLESTRMSKGWYAGESDSASQSDIASQHARDIHVTFLGTSSRHCPKCIQDCRCLMFNSCQLDSCRTILKQSRLTSVDIAFVTAAALWH